MEMERGVEYHLKKGRKAEEENDENDSFLSVKLTAPVREALLAHPQNSFIEFTSKEGGNLHIGNDLYIFSVREDAKMELYSLDKHTIRPESADKELSFVCGLAGKAVIRRGSSSLSSEETAKVRQRTLEAEAEFKKRKAISISEQVLKPQSRTSPKVSVFEKKRKTLREDEKLQMSSAAASVCKTVAKNVHHPHESTKKTATPKRKSHSDIVFRKVPSSVSMNDIRNFLSGIKLLSNLNGYFVIFCFDENEKHMPQELYMDVYVELESFNGVEVALIRNEEPLFCSKPESRVTLHIGERIYSSTVSSYSANLEYPSNSEILCAKSIGIKLSSKDDNLKQPTIQSLKEMLSEETIPFGFCLASPSLLLKTFRPQFDHFEKVLKSLHTKRPQQWLAHLCGAYVDDPTEALDDLDPVVAPYTPHDLEDICERNDRNDVLANDLRHLLADLVHWWSLDMSRKRIMTSRMEFLRRQIEFYKLLYNIVLRR